RASTVSGSPLITTSNKRYELSMSKNQLLRVLALTMVCAWGTTHADIFVANDVFGLEYASDPLLLVTYFGAAFAGCPRKYKWERDNFLIKKPGRFQRKGPGNFSNLICLYV
ncbi:hypothetical protein ACFL1J_02650, partial [Pseudomonadota bacterium]